MAVVKVVADIVVLSVKL